MRERRQLRVTDITVSYVVDGPVDAPAVVLLHGGTLNAENWSPVIDDLSKDFRVHAPDIRGHGRSSWPREHGFDRYAADLAAFIEGLQLKNVVLVGHSIGATVAMLAARHRPAWLSVLALEEPLILRPGLPRVDLKPRPERHLDCDWDNMFPALVAEFNDPDPEWWDGLADIEAPTLVFVGADPSDAKRQQIFDAAYEIEGSDVEVIPAGHGIHTDATGRFLESLRAFITRWHWGDGPNRKTEATGRIGIPR